MNLLAITKGLSFEQLGETARHVAMDKVREWQTDDNWYDYVYEQSHELLVLLGFADIEIFFEGFGSQGDGACFTGQWRQDFVKFQKAREEFLCEDLQPILDRFGGLLVEVKLQDQVWRPLRLERRGRSDCHEHSITFSPVEEADDELIHEEPDDPRLEEVFRDLMRWIYRSLQSEHEYLSSDEAVLETIEGNDYRFDESGAII